MKLKLVEALIRTLEMIENGAFKAQKHICDKKADLLIKKIDPVSLFQVFSDGGIKKNCVIHHGDISVEYREGALAKFQTISLSRDGFYAEVNAIGETVYGQDNFLFEEINLPKLKLEIRSYRKKLASEEAEKEALYLERKRAEEMAYRENQDKLIRILAPIKQAAKIGMEKEGTISFQLPNKKGRMKDIVMAFSINGVGIYQVSLMFDTHCVWLARNNGTQTNVSSIRDAEIWNFTRRMSLIEEEILEKINVSLNSL